MSRHFAILLTATVFAACSSDPRSVVEAAGPIAQDFPAEATHAAPLENYYAPPPPLPRALEPPYPHPGAPGFRSLPASLCDIIVERTRNGIQLTAVADVDRPMSGHYSFVITKGGGGNSSDIEQEGPFRSPDADVIELSSSEISLERGSTYRATLKLTSQGREVCRRTVRS